MSARRKHKILQGFLNATCKITLRQSVGNLLKYEDAALFFTYQYFHVLDGGIQKWKSENLPTKTKTNP